MERSDPGLASHRAEIAAAEADMYVDAASARARIAQVVAQAPDTDAGEAQRIQAETLLAILAAQEGRPVDAVATALRLDARASTIGAAALRARLQNVLGAAYDVLDLPERAIGHFDRCLELAREAGDDAVAAKAHTNLGVAFSRMDDDERALSHFRSALAIGEALGRGQQLARLHLDIAISLRKLGAAGDAAAALSRARGCAEASGHARTLPHLDLEDGEQWRGRGAVEAALPLLDRAVEGAGAQGQALVEVAARVARVHALMAAGRRAEALAEAEAAVGVAAGLDADGPRADALEALAAAAEESGDLARALDAHRRARAVQEARWTRRHEADLAALRVVHEVAVLERERAALADANTRLRALNADKAAFLAIASHDLRSPLTMVRILGEQLQAGRVKDLRQAGVMLDASVGRMVGIIDRLLTSEALERGGLGEPRAAVALDEVVDEAVAGLGPAAEVKRIRLSLERDGAPRVLGDAGAIGQVVTNLVDNALKFSPPGRAVAVRVWGAADKALLEVRDEGPGLSEADRARLFQKGARLSARPTAGESSHGLGLYVVHRLVTEMGGEVRAGAAPGGGATFTVVWPAL